MFNKLLVLSLLGISLNSLPGARGLPLKELQAEKERITKLLEMEQNYMNNLTDYVKDSQEPSAHAAAQVVAPKVAEAQQGQIIPQEKVIGLPQLEIQSFAEKTPVPVLAQSKVEVTPKQELVESKDCEDKDKAALASEEDKIAIASTAPVLAQTEAKVVAATPALAEQKFVEAAPVLAEDKVAAPILAEEKVAPILIIEKEIIAEQLSQVQALDIIDLKTGPKLQTPQDLAAVTDKSNMISWTESLDFIHKLEKDYDITVSKDDIARLKAQFDSADINGKGEITVNEFKDSIGDDKPRDQSSLVQIISRQMGVIYPKEE